MSELIFLTRYNNLVWGNKKNVNGPWGNHLRAPKISDWPIDHYFGIFHNLFFFYINGVSIESQ